jgi:hypothetical protein
MKELRKRLAEQRKKAKSKKGLKEAEGLFRELEKQTEKMAEAAKFLDGNIVTFTTGAVDICRL